MSKVRFSPTASINVVRMAVVAVLAAGLLAVAMLSGSGVTSASANPNFNCTQAGLVPISIVCVGQNTVTVTIGNVTISPSILNGLQVDIENVLNNNGNNNDVLNVVLVALNHNNIHVCNVNVASALGTQTGTCS